MVAHKKQNKIISAFRKIYQWRFVFRSFVLIATFLLYHLAPGQFDVLSGLNFFREFSVFHILWVLWIIDMILQLCPCRHYWPLGSQKFLKTSFQPMLDRINKEGLLEYIKKCNRDTLLIGTIWAALIIIIGALYTFTELVNKKTLLVISVAFYVCDLICVLFWCPFRIWFMKNRCCTTCRIFNWDHMMMFTPLIFIPGFYTWTLVLASFVVFFVWEVTFAIHPERFWDGSNAALQCSNCTDQLCGKRNCQIDIPQINNLK